MKQFCKILCVILALFTAVFAAGCKNNKKNNESLPDSVQSQIQSDSSHSESSANSDITDNSSSQNSSSDSEKSESSESGSSAEETPIIDENGTYCSKDEVALYIHTYGKLPKNYMTKKEAEKLGWSGGSLEKYAPGMCIGGDYFGNYDGLLPKKSGRKYTECDIDTLGQKTRGAKRIVFSNDGLIYYTDDHYESFTLLYGSEE